MNGYFKSMMNENTIKRVEQEVKALQGQMEKSNITITKENRVKTLTIKYGETKSLERLVINR